MTETFFGEWSVKVERILAGFAQRFIITGSDSSDGTYPGALGTVLPRVSGKQWTLAMEWNDNAGSGWQPSDIRRAASYTVREGLVVHLGADDNTFDPARDFDFDDLVLVCTNLEPAVNPFSPSPPPFEFTLSEHMLVPVNRGRT
jgi:hypothetical protein